MDKIRSIALIPLDDRPSHLHLLVHLGRLVGRTVDLPPRELLGHFRTPGQPPGLGEWLRRQTEAEAVLVAADMLAYGGFLAAHTLAVPEAVALAHLTALEDLRAAAPETPLLTCSILLGDSSRSPVPQEEQDRLHSRNQAIHRRLVDYLVEGIMDYLLLVPEPSTFSPPCGRGAGEGPEATTEPEMWAQLAAAGGVRDRLGVYPGGTAATAILLTRVVLQAHASPVRVAVRCASTAGAAEVRAEENQPLHVTLANLMETAGARCAPSPEETEVGLFVNTPRDVSSPDAEGAAQKPGPNGPEATNLSHFADEIAPHLARGAVVALADVAFPQRADPLLLEELARREALPYLAGYAGGDTLPNDLGKALAQGCLVAVARGWSEAAKAAEQQKNLAAVFHRHFRKIAQLLQAEKTFILLLDKGCQRLTPLLPAIGFDQTELETLEFSATEEFWSQVLALKTVSLEAGRPTDLSGSPRALEALGAHNGVIVSLLAPHYRPDLLLEEPQPIGLLCVLNKRSGTFSGEDETLLALLARQAGAVLRNMRRGEEEWKCREAIHWLQTTQHQHQLLLVRFLEDWGYQTMVRPDLEQQLPAGVAAGALGAAHQSVEVQMREQMWFWTRTFLETHWCGRTLQSPHGASRARLPDRIPCHFSLPWPCTEEVQVEVSLTLETIPETEIRQLGN